MKRLEYFYASIMVLVIHLGVFLLQNKFINYFLFINNGINKAKLFLNILFVIFSFAYLFLGYRSYKIEKRRSLGTLFIIIGFLSATYYIPLVLKLLVRVF